MNENRLKYSLLISLLWIIILATPSALHAQQAGFNIAGGGHLKIEGETFTFEQLSTVVGEDIVITEHAMWDGGVVAILESEYDTVTLETGHINVVFDGENVKRLEAGPQVKFMGYHGRAVFECADVVIDFPTSEEDGNVYSGVCTNLHGYFLAYASELGLEGDDSYEINFTASSATLGPDSAVLTAPRLSLGDINKPEFAVGAKEIEVIIGEHPETGERTPLAARIDYFAVQIFGNRLNILPFPIWRKLVSVPEPGLMVRIPKIGYEGGQGPYFDFAPAYNFMLPGLGDTPSIIFRANIFPFDRTYPEIRALVERDDLFAEVRGGYRREETSEGDPVATRAEPEFTVGHRWIPLNDNSLGLRLSASYGHIRDMTNSGPDLDRFGWNARLEHRGIPVGDFTLRGFLDLNDFYYDNDENYQSLEGGVSLRYVDPPSWGSTLYYRTIYEWGTTPFAFDIPKTVEEVGLREQSRFSRRWGGGFDWSWNLDEDDFQRQECHLTYIFDSFQVSTGWDFADNAVRVYFALPGDLH